MSTLLKSSLNELKPRFFTTPHPVNEFIRHLCGLVVGGSIKPLHDPENREENQTEETKKNEREKQQPQQEHHTPQATDKPTARQAHGEQR